ncbi:PREDICTED: transport and Golgi organization protein 2 isoform X3 [Bactrocera latifrons]|uniref:transport and Golgi organization protein 2 isoform X3 n=1 Tax=Bactrocera latifrons TaxID=174628 RepID=UPI0008DE7D02|nr:PREDICTED: transport and Golgi organization protein 2 isoform X3 [Bactrocera latifrons]
MCVIFFYVNSNPTSGGYKLILASNRDEYFARDTQDAAKWANAEHVYGVCFLCFEFSNYISGIDLEPGREGGTWLAIGGHGGVFKIGALLNLTGEPKPRNAAGRGMIVSNFVSSTDDCNIKTYNAELLADCTKYSAFNFVSIEIGDAKRHAAITLLSNSPPTLEHFVDGKCYGFGNSLDAVPFQKVIHGRQRFQNIVENFNKKLSNVPLENAQILQNELVTNLKNLLKCKQKFWPDAELKRRAPNWGEHLSALNVNVPLADYGSRTHTVILIDEHNKMHFYEETMAGLNPEGEWRQTHIVKHFFQIS